VTLDTELLRISPGPLLVASDFDGTLAPIVAHPEDARGNERALRAMARLATHPRHTVAIVSGRRLDELQQLTGSPHGIELIGEHGNVQAGHETAPHPELPQLEAAVRAVVSSVDGAVVEVKKYSVAFHYRQVAEEDAVDALAELREVCARRPGVSMIEGKKVFEMGLTGRDKGDAVMNLATEIGADAVLFIGDDTTDETVFSRLGPGDVGVKVGEGPTSAGYRIDDVEAVADLLECLEGLASSLDQPD